MKDERLKLDKSSAYRRLRAAEDAGFIINLEPRKGRPGRYRVTGQTVEAEQMLPTAAELRRAVAGSTAATVHPCNPAPTTLQNQLVEGCTAERNHPCNQLQPDAVADAAATNLATNETPRIL